MIKLDFTQNEKCVVFAIYWPYKVILQPGTIGEEKALEF